MNSHLLKPHLISFIWYHLISTNNFKEIIYKKVYFIWCYVILEGFFKKKKYKFTSKHLIFSSDLGLCEHFLNNMNKKGSSNRGARTSLCQIRQKNMAEGNKGMSLWRLKWEGRNEAMTPVSCVYQKPTVINVTIRKGPHSTAPFIYFAHIHWIFALLVCGWEKEENFPS